MGNLHWKVDALVVREGTYFGSGWIFHEEKKLLNLCLMVRFDNGEDQSISMNFGKPMDYVGALFPKLHVAKYSGFTLLGSCNQEQKSLGELFLRATLEDGFVYELPIPRSCIRILGGGGISARRISIRQLFIAFSNGLYLIKRGFYLIKRGFYLMGTLKKLSCQSRRVSSLFNYPDSRLRMYDESGVTQHFLMNGFQIASLFGRTISRVKFNIASFFVKADAVIKTLDASELHYTVLIIDHEMGGGANHYRERMVAEKIKEGVTVFILSYQIMTLSYILMVQSIQRNNRFVIPGYEYLLEIAEQLQIKEIIYNNGVTFAHPEELVLLIINLKRKYHPRLTLLIHDFFMVCPSPYLLSDTGKYCEIPDIGRCQECLVHNKQDFCLLSQSRNIVQWRSLWGDAIDLADEVRVFSNDSLKTLQKAYPSFDPSHAVVKPHKVEYFKHGPIQPPYTATLKIGVVGQIGFAKGARIVQEIAEEIKIRKLDIQIVIIGTIEVPYEQSVVRETGPYTHDRLPALIENTGVNIMLFPSICPETFSYVVQELIELNLPVACFSLGAPAERISKYAKGLILEEMTASATLNNLILFFQRIYGLKA